MLRIEKVEIKVVERNTQPHSSSHLLTSTVLFIYSRLKIHISFYFKINNSINGNGLDKK